VPSHILLVEDNKEEAESVKNILTKVGTNTEIEVVGTHSEYLSALGRRRFDLILSDINIPDLEGLSALEIAKGTWPESSFIFLTKELNKELAIKSLEIGATDYIAATDLWRLPPLIKKALSVSTTIQTSHLEHYNQSLARLISAIQELSLARTMEQVMDIVRHTARHIMKADGATFVMREEDQCYYAEEDTIEPLWKGKRFPMSICIGGWAMIHNRPVTIKDVYNDTRIPIEAYRPTFIKSLAMAPIRKDAPIGAIGSYWATHHETTPEEISLLQALADSTSIALENIQLYSELEKRVKERTQQLEDINVELEAFSYSVSHDLQAPTRSIRGYSNILLKEYGDQLPEDGKVCVRNIIASNERMSVMIKELLDLSKVSGTEIKKEIVSLTEIVNSIASELRSGAEGRRANFIVEEDVEVYGDAALLRIVLDNLLSNAWKYTSKSTNARIEFGSTEQPNGSVAYYIRDNGVGFDMKDANKLFMPFHRFHSDKDFPGFGIGLATVKRIINRHGGQLWADSSPNEGAVFYFTLPDDRAYWEKSIKSLSVEA
jgi:signal transduction histidine kinase/CheY-like chemotaxis protein